MKRSTLSLIAVTALCGAAPALAAQAPPQTDVYLTELNLFDGAYFLGELTNISNRPTMYDNQPAFTPDSRSVLFTSQFDDGNDGQTDIRRYYIESGRAVKITRSDVESEYSATPVPGDRAFSAIRVEADSTQRLWRFTMQGMDAEPVLRDIAPVGYHAWADDADSLILFVLGQPATLQFATVSSQRGEVLAEGPGRSLHKIPTENAFSFTQTDNGEVWLKRVDIGSREISAIIPTIEGGQDHAWTPDGIVIMASGSKVYQYNPEVDQDWREIADYTEQGLTFSRLAVSPDGAHIALVGLAVEEEGN